MNAFRRQARDERPGLLVPDEDVYAVRYLEDGTVIVRHYPDRRTRAACCTAKGRITEADRAEAFDFELRKGASAALARAYQTIERRHAQAAAAGDLPAKRTACTTR